MQVNMYVALVLSLCVIGKTESVLTDKSTKHDIGIGIALVRNLYDLTKDVLDINDRLRITEDKLQKSDSLLTKNVTDITKRVVDAEIKLQSCRDETDLLKQKEALKMKVAFMASPAKNFKTVAGAKVNFDNIITNEGNAYNVITSTFTAPVAGIYFFGLTIGVSTPSKASDYLRLHIMKNDVISSYIFIGWEGLWTKRSENVVLSLSKDDTVYVKIKTAPTEIQYIGGTSSYPGGKFLSHFSGFLIN